MWDGWMWRMNEWRICMNVKKNGQIRIEHEIWIKQGKTKNTTCADVWNRPSTLFITFHNWMYDGNNQFDDALKKCTSRWSNLEEKNYLNDKSFLAMIHWCKY